MHATWGIIGLGWLGFELSRDLGASGHECWGTHRDSFDFASSEIPSRHCDVLLLNTPPLKQLSPELYARRVERTLAPRILFVSSTSIYGGQTGKIVETTEASPLTESARWLLQVEELLQRKFRARLTIVRPGGLIGGDRHPVFTLSGKKNIPNGNHSINLIHRADLIAILRAVADQHSLAIVNAAAPFHPRRDEYYKEWALKLGLPKLSFEMGSEQDRVIESHFLPQLHNDWICGSLNFI